MIFTQLTSLPIIKFFLLDSLIWLINCSNIFGITVNRLGTNGHQDGTLLNPNTLSYLVDPDLLLSYNSPRDLNSIGSINLFESSKQLVSPVESTIGSIVSNRLVHSIDLSGEEIENLRDDNLIVKPKRNILIYTGNGNGLAELSGNGNSESDKDENKIMVIRKLIGDGNGDLGEIDWVKDKGHKKHGWKNIYHKEESGGTDENHDDSADKGWKKRFRGLSRRGIKSLATEVMAKRRKRLEEFKQRRERRRQQRKRKSQRNVENPIPVKDVYTLGSSHKIPDTLWTYLT